jgi:hypothetical protein
MRRFFLLLLFASVMTVGVQAVYGQDDADRVKTREQLGALLDRVGPNIKVAFRRSEKQPFNFVGKLTEGLTYSDSMEIVIGVTAKQTIGFRIYPHYKGGYINVEKAKNSMALMRQLLRLSDQAFLYWGMDDTSDVFAGYTFTLESGFPAEAITVVLRSIVNLDKFVGDMKPAIDGAGID